MNKMRMMNDVTNNEWARVESYESGFNNLSNFNRQFKKITEKSPLEYRKEQRKSL